MLPKDAKEPQEEYLPPQGPGDEEDNPVDKIQLCAAPSLQYVYNRRGVKE